MARQARGDRLTWCASSTAACLRLRDPVEARGGPMFKQICFFRKRPDMTMEEFMDYYENRHSQLSKRMGRAPSIPNAVRYVRRYLTPERNPVTGEVIDPGFDC